MKAISFTLSGQTAFFKKPDVNAYAYFTYNNIHKIALIGMLGAIIGLRGYKEQEKNIYPEFYEKLKDLKISIAPISKNGYFSKKIQVFNNTTGFYNKDSKRNPCTLNYREQWLYNPKWQIYLLDDNSIDRNVFDKISDYLLNRKCEYIPYLGKNDHYADISDVSEISLKKPAAITTINSLFIDNGSIQNSTSCASEENLYVMTEVLPVSLDEKDNAYEYNNFIFTNLLISNSPKDDLIFKDSNKTLYFF